MIPSAVRTLVPFLVALVAPWALAHLGVGTDQLSAAVTVLLGAIYYLAVRVVEHYWPAAGWLLGIPTAPTYPPKG